MKTTPTQQIHPLSVAPMMRRTDRHFRYFMRQMTRRTLLYTQMHHTREILNSERRRALAYSPDEHPLALQLGGDDPAQMAECARIAQDWGYDEVNINVGCPSSRVQQANFGVCLMGQPDVVADCVDAMQAAVDIPVTVKHRIGFDERDSFEDMSRFVRIVSQAGCRRFTVHARKAWLDGLSPKENRNVPPLRYEAVYRLKRKYPQLAVEINGGIDALDAANDHLDHVDAVMIGRAAYDRPYLFARADQQIYGDKRTPPSRTDVVEAMVPYIEKQLTAGHKLSHVTSHMLNLFAFQPGASRWRRHLSENAHRDDAGPEVIRQALARVKQVRASA